MADYQIRVSADTKTAQTQLVKVDKIADKATRARDIKIGVPDVGKVAKAYENIQTNASKAANGIKQFYNFSKKIPAIGERVGDVENLAKGINNAAQAAPQLAANLKESSKAGNILATSVKTTNSALMTMVTNLAKVGFAIYAVKEAVNLLKGAFQGFFNDTIGREIKLRETLLKTQTTLASTSKVFKNGEEITDPLEKIETLTASVEENIKSIRQRSLELAGVTSGEVIEVFGMVAQQISNIGGGLKEAEDLAIQFAAALGTFGIPLYQARQEIGSILRGDITMDSYLAKSLGITNEDIAEAKTKAGGVVKFLEDRLKAAVAGQAIAAKGFAGVTSNIAEIAEEIKRNFGAGLLDPLLGGLTNIYELLFKISSAAFEAANAIGESLGNSLANLAVLLGGAGIRSLDIGAELAQSISGAFEGAINKLSQDMIYILEPLKNVFGEIIKSVAVLAKGLGKLAAGFASLQVEKFKALINALEAITPILTGIVAGFSELLKLYGDVLKQPMVQYFAQLGVTMKLVEGLGVKMAVQLGALAAVVIAKWKPVVAFFAALGAKITGSLAVIMTGTGALFAKIGAVITAFAGVLLKAVPASEALALSLQKLAAQMGVMGVNATKAGAQVGTMAGAMKGAAAGIGGIIMNMVKLNLIIFAVVGTISLVVDGMGRWKRAQEKAARTRAAEQSLNNLKSGLYDVKEGLDAATQAKKDFDEAMVRSQQDAVKEELNEVLEKIRELEERTKDWKTKGGIAYRKTKLAPLQKEEARLLKELNRLDFELKKKNAKDIIKLESDMRRKMEKEIKELRKQVEDDIFRQQQRLARLQLEKMRLQAEIETRKLSRELQERLKGEEGISRKVTENLNKYLLAKKKGEDTIAQRQKSLQIELAGLDKEIADYKYNIQKKIAKLQKDMGEFEKKVADYKLEKMREQAKNSSGGSYDGNFGDDAVGKLTAAIVSKESGGDYNAHNMDAGNGGAIGIGQVMAANVPSWTMKHYGESLTPEQYKKNHAAQNAVVRGQVKDYYTTAKGQGYSDEEAARRVASQWYSGNPDLHTSTRPQMAGGNEYPSISSYADDVVGRMGTTKAEAPVAPEADKSMPDYNPVINAMEKVKGLMVEINGLQDQLTGQDRVDAFNNILDGAYGDETGMEGLVDQANALNAQLTAISQLSGGPMDPATIQLTSQMIAERERLRLEKMQIIKSIQDDDYLKEEEKAQLLKTNNEEYNKGLEALNNIAAKKEEILGIQQAINYASQAAADIETMQNQTQDLLLENRLKMEGMNDLQVRAELRKVRIYRAQQKALQGVTDPEARQKILDLTNQQITAVEKLAKAQQAAANPMTRLYQQWKADLSDVNGYYAQMAQTVQQELGNAMASAITGVIDGSTTIQEAMSNMFKNIGQAFIQMATQMIAKALIMKVLGIPMGGMFGGGGAGGFGGGYFNPMTGLGSAGPNFGLAEGGFVDSPTSATIGEGGEPEYVIPQSKMDDSMARWNSGSRGSAVLDPVTGSGTGEGTGFGEEAFNPNIVINGGVMNYGGEDYIKRSELPGIVGQAAKSGEERALRKLRMSPSARKKIGL